MNYILIVFGVMILMASSLHKLKSTELFFAIYLICSCLTDIIIFWPKVGMYHSSVIHKSFIVVGFSFYYAAFISSGLKKTGILLWFIKIVGDIIFIKYIENNNVFPSLMITFNLILIITGCLTYYLYLWQNIDYIPLRFNSRFLLFTATLVNWSISIAYLSIWHFQIEMQIQDKSISLFHLFVSGAHLIFVSAVIFLSQTVQWKKAQETSTRNLMEIV